jgi:alpha-galactosidase
MRKPTVLISSLVVLLVGTVAGQDAPRAFHQWAPTPPMGWNSWDIFGTTLTEAQAKAQADAMARYLLPAGYKYFTVDIQWYEPNAKSHVYQAGAPLEIDQYSRLLPAVNKFPSAANGAGFKPLADHVHARGLKFGIHLMRGIPRQAVRDNTAILGTDVRAADIADTDSTCPWNPDMYGVDLRRPGAQAYYDSLFELYASWSVDYVKVDDISRPYDATQQAEIEAIRTAIDKTGRPIVLSLSPGATPLERGAHVRQHANLWRISDDFWDRWQPLRDMFERLHKWTPHRANGAWPDADMLPFGFVEFGRPTRFTKDDQRVCMTLWCVARSPLIFGGDMTKLDKFTLDLLTNPEVIAVNQTSTNNRQLTRDGDLIVWTADDTTTDDRYVALFNAYGDDAPFDLSLAEYRSATIRGKPGEQTADIRVSIKGAKRLVLAVDNGGDGFFFDHAAWIEPRLSGPPGVLKLTDLDWTMGISGWGQTRKNRTCDDRPLTLNDQPAEGIGTHSVSFVEFKLPAGYDTFTARGVTTAGSEGKGSIEFVVLVDPQKPQAGNRTVSVRLSQLGISGAAKVRDLWARKDLGECRGVFSREIKERSVGFYRLSPVTP